MDAGELVPDDVVIGIVEERLRAARRAARLHPRRLPAHGGAGRGARRDARRTGSRSTPCVQIAVPRDELVDALAGRRVCRDCGTMYQRDRAAGGRRALRRCGGALVQRDDDARRRSAARMEVYERADGAADRATTASEGLLREVDGHRRVADERLQSALASGDGYGE